MIKRVGGILAVVGLIVFMLLGTQVDANASMISYAALQSSSSGAAKEQEAAYDSDLEKSNITVDDFRLWWSEGKVTKAYITPEHDLIYFGKTPGRSGYGYETFHIISITEDDFNEMEKSDIDYDFSSIERVDEDFLKEYNDGDITVTTEQDAIFFEAEINDAHKQYVCTDFEKEYLYKLAEQKEVMEKHEDNKRDIFFVIWAVLFFISPLIGFAICKAIDKATDKRC